MPVVATGCPKAQGTNGEDLARLEDFKNKMCACRDTRCGQAVSDELTAWVQARQARYEDPPTMSEEDTRKTAEIGAETRKCLKKAMETRQRRGRFGALTVRGPTHAMARRPGGVSVQANVSQSHAGHTYEVTVAPMGMR